MPETKSIAIFEKAGYENLTANLVLKIPEINFLEEV